jgi:hypothetical protein
VANDLSLYVGSIFSVLVMAVQPSLRYKLFLSLSVPALMHIYCPRLLDGWDEQTVARVVVVLDLFGLPMTLGAVGVLEGR